MRMSIEMYQKKEAVDSVFTQTAILDEVIRHLPDSCRKHVETAFDSMLRELTEEEREKVRTMGLGEVFEGI